MQWVSKFLTRCKMAFRLPWCVVFWGGVCSIAEFVILKKYNSITHLAVKLISMLFGLLFLFSEK